MIKGDNKEKEILIAITTGYEIATDNDTELKYIRAKEPTVNHEFYDLICVRYDRHWYAMPVPIIRKALSLDIGDIRKFFPEKEWQNRDNFSYV